MLTTVIMTAAELYARSQPTGTAAPAAPGELEGAEEELPAARAGTRVHRHHGRATGTVTDAEDAQRELDRLPVVKAASIGLGQALALIPGTSRSGITISVGLFQGVSRETAARFSFLLSIPTILGAGILELDELSTATETQAELAAGALAAAVRS